MATGAFTPSVDGCLIISFINDDINARLSTQYTAGTSPVAFTTRGTASNDPAGASDTTYAVEDAVQVTAASINPTWTEAVADVAVAIGAAFKPLITAGLGANFGNYAHPGASPGLGGINPAPFHPSNLWPDNPPAPPAFGRALMSPKEEQGNTPPGLPPQ